MSRHAAQNAYQKTDYVIELVKEATTPQNASAIREVALQTPHQKAFDRFNGSKFAEADSHGQDYCKKSREESSHVNHLLVHQTKTPDCVVSSLQEVV